MDHIAGLLNPQARARRSALLAARRLRARRDEQQGADRALGVADADAASPVAARRVPLPRGPGIDL